MAYLCRALQEEVSLPPERMQTLTSFLLKQRPSGLVYDDAAQLCLRLHCVIDGVPSELRSQTTLPALADVFAELARIGWVREQSSPMSSFYGARLHEVTDRGHWVEVIASIYKKGDVVDVARGDALAALVGFQKRVGM